MGEPIDICFSHLGFLVRDMPAMVDFYTRHLGLLVTDRGPLALPGNPDIVFLSSDPEEHHQIAFISGREQEDSILGQVSFRVGDMAQLRSLIASLRDDGVEQMLPMSHGNAWSVYFKDPDGNTVECFVPSPFHVRQPVTNALDLTLDDEALLRQTEEEYSKAPDFGPREQWQAEFAKRLARPHLSGEGR